MPQNLTARFVETVKPKAGERTTISDSVVEGLELRLGSNGSKMWSLRYRTRGGKRNRLSLSTAGAKHRRNARNWMGASTGTQGRV